MKEAMPVHTERADMRLIGQHDHLLVIRAQRAEERDEILFRRDPVMFATQNEHRTGNQRGIDDG